MLYYVQFERCRKGSPSYIPHVHLARTNASALVVFPQAVWSGLGARLLARAAIMTQQLEYRGQDFRYHHTKTNELDTVPQDDAKTYLFLDMRENVDWAYAPPGLCELRTKDARCFFHPTDGCEHPLRDERGAPFVLPFDFKPPDYAEIRGAPSEALTTFTDLQNVMRGWLHRQSKATRPRKWSDKVDLIRQHA